MRRVGNFGETKRLPALHAGPAFSAVDGAAFVAGPCLGERNLESLPSGDDVRLAHADEGPQDPHGVPVGESYGPVQGADKRFAAVGIDGVVPRVGRVGHGVESARNGPGGRRSDQEHVPIGDHGDLHAVGRVMSVGDRDLFRGQTARGHEMRDPPEIRDLVGHFQVAADMRRVLELARVALAVVDGEGLDLVAAREQMVEEDCGIQSSGIDDNDFCFQETTAEKDGAWILWKGPGIAETSSLFRGDLKMRFL